MDNRQARRDFLKITVGLGAAVSLLRPSDSALGQRPGFQAEELDFFEVVRTRRSVRKFKEDPVPEEHLRRILDAARLAPTSGNQQPWKFLVVRDRALLDRLKENCIALSLEARRARQGSVTPEQEDSVRQYFTDYLSAPVYVVVLTDGQSMYPTYNHWDGPLAAGYLMLAARALGYGTVFATDSIPEEVTREVLNIPQRYTRVCFTPIGVPEAWPDSPEKKELEEFIVNDRF